MPAIRRILGHVSIEIAKVRRKCHRNPKKHKICRGEACLVVRDGNGNGKNYCSDCANLYRVAAETALQELDPRRSAGLALP